VADVENHPTPFVVLMDDAGEGGAVKYLMLVCVDEDVDPNADPTPWIEEVERRGVRRLGNRLRPVRDSTTVRVRDGEVLVADGPFAETKEQIGGFDILECADLDEAIEVASKHPAAAFGTLELRPFWDV
jgi:hypothetical protein